MLAETKHKKVGDAGSDEGMEAAVAKGVVDEEKTGDQSIDMPSCSVRNIKVGLEMQVVSKEQEGKK